MVAAVRFSLTNAVFSSAGGARAFFYLGEAGQLKLVVGPNVLREADEVVRHKVPESLPLLAQLLAAGQLEISMEPTQWQVETAQRFILHLPDVYVLSEAIQAQPDWFVTHDQKHFFKRQPVKGLQFRIGTPGDLLQEFKDNYDLN